jgi:hypothetical protein
MNKFLDKKIFNLRSKSSGFSMMETLIAIAVLTIGVVGPVYSVFTTIRAAEVSQDRTISFYLAEEGVEYIRYVRDSNVLDPSNLPGSEAPKEDGWLRYLDRCLAPDKCGLITPTQNVDRFSDLKNCNPTCQLSIANTNGLYGTASGPPTKFFRSIEIIETIPGQEAEITVTVTWDTKGKQYTYILREVIFNWSGG